MVAKSAAPIVRTKPSHGPRVVDALDLQLLEAWDRVVDDLRDDPAEAMCRIRKTLHSQLSAPLRSWALVLRSGDTRIGACGGRAEQAVTLTREDVARLCRPVAIPWPGVTVPEAARRLGVSRKTVWAWTKLEARASKADGQEEDGQANGGRLLRRYGKLLVRDVYVNAADRKRDGVRVWTLRAIEPGGQVSSAPWGQARLGLADLVPVGFEQQLARRLRRITGRCEQWQWVCPRCGQRVYKLYWPMPTWTLAASVLGVSSAQLCGWMDGQWKEAFSCRRCAALVYESSEAHWRADEAGQAVFWDRFVRRMTVGLVRGGDMGTRLPGVVAA